MTEKQVWNMIPKSKHPAIKEAFIDSDGIWIALNPGWNADGMDYPARLIHCGESESDDAPEVIKDLKYQISEIRKLSKAEQAKLQVAFPQYEW